MKKEKIAKEIIRIAEMLVTAQDFDEEEWKEAYWGGYERSKRLV